MCINLNNASGPRPTSKPSISMQTKEALGIKTILVLNKSKPTHENNTHSEIILLVSDTTQGS